MNEEQRRVVSERTGPRLVAAVPGSGKTETLISCVRSLVESGVKPGEICGLTFTKEAAAEMEKRAGLKKSDHKIFRTFHSFCLDFVTKERLNFPFRLERFPLLTPHERGKILGGLLKKFRDVEFHDVSAYIGLMKRRGISPESAENEALGDFQVIYARIYRLYEKACREHGQLDFDSMIIESVALLEDNADVRARWQFKYILVDEAQDTDLVQLRMVQLLSEQHRNIRFFGDGNQCQPPGTKVRVLAKRSIPSTFKEVSIEDLQPGDEVVSWTKHDQRIYHVGRKINWTVRPYIGDLLTIETNGKATQVTPNHKVWARFSSEVFKKNPYYVYLMWRADRGFRVGISYFRRKGGHNQISHRGLQEKAERFWIVRVVETRQEAEVAEEIFSIKYGIPQCMFHPYNGVKRTEEQIKEVFAAANRAKAHQALEDCGRLFECPLIMWPDGTQRVHGYFLTAAANLLPSWMEMPTDAPYRGSLVDRVGRNYYEGPVYSLDVEKDHTYIADGIPVGNSMYAFRGADPEMLTRHVFEAFPQMEELPLSVNYRSTQTIVDYLKDIAPVQNEAVRKMNSVAPAGAPIEFKYFAGDDREAEVTVAAVTDPDNTAVLARTNRQLRAFERACMNRCIRYRLLGDSGFWKQEEVKTVMAFVQQVVAPSDHSTKRVIRSPYDCTRFLKKTEAIEFLEHIVERRPEGLKLHHVWKDVNLGDTRQNEILQGIVTMFQRLRGQVFSLNGEQALKRILDEANILNYYRDNEHVKEIDNDPVENIQDLLKDAKKFPSLYEFYLYARKAARAPERETGLTLSTIHQAKGKQWREVFVVGVNDGMLPHKNGEPEEEKCIYYVACSRAALKLTVSCNDVPSPYIRSKLPKQLDQTSFAAAKDAKQFQSLLELV